VSRSSALPTPRDVPTFSVVDAVTPVGTAPCAACRGAIVDTYYETDQGVICVPCQARMTAPGQPRTSEGQFGRALTFGVLAAIATAAGYIALLATTGRELTATLFLIGLVVGKAVRTGARGRGGRRFQWLAVALTYLAIGDGTLRGAEGLGLDDPFLRAFSFSVGVFTTTGTGPMYVHGATAHWLVNFESFAGPITLVLAFGLLIARLTRPRMRLAFSESAVIAPYEGGRGFMFRMVNIQPSELSDVQVRVNLARFEDFDGSRERNFHELALERNSVEFFTLHWTVVHPITADSPLAGVTPESLAASQAEFLISVSALDETFSTRVTARSSYLWDELRWDVKFASIFANGPDGMIAIDVERLSRTERLDDGATRNPAALERAAG